MELAAERGEPFGPAHLVAAVLDQGDPRVVAALGAAKRTANSFVGGPLGCQPCGSHSDAKGNVVVEMRTLIDMVERSLVLPGGHPLRAWAFEAAGV